MAENEFLSVFEEFDIDLTEPMIEKCKSKTKCNDEFKMCNLFLNTVFVSCRKYCYLFSA